MSMNRSNKAANPLVPTKNETQNQAQGWTDAPKPTAADKLESVISVRFDAEATALIRRAANLQGGSRSDFVRAASLSEARRVIAAHETRSAQILRVDSPTVAISQPTATSTPAVAGEGSTKSRGTKMKTVGATGN